MEEELQKRNTDCVYFLASPLTCKKVLSSIPHLNSFTSLFLLVPLFLRRGLAHFRGAECEYRHSEMARLNPRDCWFWLSGTCLNPTCAFRHPVSIHLV
ncbi:Zinc finger CCCH domain-containing protein 17 [Linum perenne]